MEEIESNPILARLRTSILNKNNSLKTNLSNLTTNKILQSINTAKPQVVETPIRPKEIKQTSDNLEKQKSIYTPPIRSCSNSKPNKNLSVNTSSTRDSFITPNQTAIQNDSFNAPRRSQANPIRGIIPNLDEDESFSAKTYNTRNNPNIPKKRLSDAYCNRNESNTETYNINGKVRDLAAEFKDLLNKDSEIERKIEQ